MPKLAANLSTMFVEVPFLDRFERAARAGFTAVEFQFPYAHPAAEIRVRLDATGLRCVMFNLPPGDWEAGERGLAALPGREPQFADGVERAIDYARELGVTRLHAMAGVTPPTADVAEMRRTYVANLREAARRAAAAGIVVLIEPINRRDIPGYFIDTQAEAHAVRAAVGAPNLAVQMDLYHCQIVEGDLAVKLRRHLHGVGHVQIAGVPDRHEPDSGEVAFDYLLDLLDQLAYTGWVGCEYRPRAGTEAGLGWARRWLDRPA